MTEQKYFLKGIANSKVMITRLYEVFSKSIEFTEEDSPQIGLRNSLSQLSFCTTS